MLHSSPCSGARGVRGRRRPREGALTLRVSGLLLAGEGGSAVGQAAYVNGHHRAPGNVRAMRPAHATSPEQLAELLDCEGWLTSTTLSSTRNVQSQRSPKTATTKASQPESAVTTAGTSV